MSNEVWTATTNIRSEFCLMSYTFPPQTEIAARGARHINTYLFILTESFLIKIQEQNNAVAIRSVLLTCCFYKVCKGKLINHSRSSSPP